MIKEIIYEKLKAAFIDGLDSLTKFLDKQKQDKYSFFSIDSHKNFPVLRNAELNVYPTFYVGDSVKSDYSSVFSNWRYSEKAEKPESWQDYKSYILSNEELCRYFKIGGFYPIDRKEGGRDFWEDFMFDAFVGDLIDAYIHKHSKEFNESFFLEMFNLYYNSISSKKLIVDVLIPIILVDFTVVDFHINENISLIHMPNSLQISRNIRLSSNRTSHPDVAGAATHAFLFKNISFDNADCDSIYNTLSDIEFYKNTLVEVDYLFACLRSVSKVETGYCQIVARPLGWQSNFKADLEETFVASDRKYPSHFENNAWYKAYSLVDEKKCEDIRLLYSGLRGDASKGLASFDLPIQRLNKACLNSPDDDAIIDAAIALESLLISSDAHGEINYKLSTRVSLLHKFYPFSGFSPEGLAALCKKIYAFRSVIVHGNAKKLDSLRIVGIDGNDELTVVVAIRLLEHIIQVRVLNKQFAKAEDIDKLIFQLELPSLLTGASDK